ncbi:hypothetical protein JZ751_024113 [Albula glossodonta]|uniref:Uncharacterized protein n=1 Tax=Albula glossodonta TaxID=121402 RepID=A0A8T2NGG4_9TELE|nr:hypothetical protein JZ751_024113 [Albula glossodonta]
MFGVMHPGRKYSPTQYLSGLSPLTVSTDDTLPNSQVNKNLEKGPEKMSPPPNAKMRNSKAKGMRAMKRHPSPSRSLEAAAAVSNEVHHEKGLNPAERGGAAPRSRKRGYRPPDVRTIFECQEKDPRVPEEKGEGHTFCPVPVSGAWCDLCCLYIFQNGLTCTAMGLGKGFGKTLQRLSDFFYRIPKIQLPPRQRSTFPRAEEGRTITRDKQNSFSHQPCKNAHRSSLCWGSGVFCDSGPTA